MKGTKKLICTILMVCSVHANAQTADTMSDKDQLTVALEYFSSGKYIEARNLLTRLDRRYKLNPRFKAYIGLCHYYTWEYGKAVEYFDPYIDELDVYAPHERSIYYFADAESHFLLEEYDKAIPVFEKALTVCYDNEKGDIFFRLAYCYMSRQEWQNALDALDSSLKFYERFGYPENKSARVIQIQKMTSGCKKKLNEEKEIHATNATTDNNVAEKEKLR